MIGSLLKVGERIFSGTIRAFYASNEIKKNSKELVVTSARPAEFAADLCIRAIKALSYGAK